MLGFILPSNRRPLKGGLVPLGMEAHVSTSDDDRSWDDFLRSHELGHYQQSSLWGQFKQSEGWNVRRIVVQDGAALHGGFQLLWKKRGPARVGYVSKGPVGPRESLPWLQRLAAAEARNLGLQALVAQLPDGVATESTVPDLFLVSNPMKVIEATYLVDVSAGLDAVRQRMHPKTRQYVRKALEAGFTTRSGGEADLPLFFALMAETCRRQETRPNPSSVSALARLWRLFAPTGEVEMSFARLAGRDVAGRMNLIFGRRVTQWKKGWDGTVANLHPNEYLADDALAWAIRHGFPICDFSAMNRSHAVRLLGGAKADHSLARSRDMFNLRLGGQPVLLPRATVFIANPLARQLYWEAVALREQRRPTGSQA